MCPGWSCRHPPKGRGGGSDHVQQRNQGCCQLPVFPLGSLFLPQQRGRKQKELGLEARPGGLQPWEPGPAFCSSALAQTPGTPGKGPFTSSALRNESHFLERLVKKETHRNRDLPFAKEPCPLAPGCSPWGFSRPPGTRPHLVFPFALASACLFPPLVSPLSVDCVALGFRFQLQGPHLGGSEPRPAAPTSSALSQRLPSLQSLPPPPATLPHHPQGLVGHGPPLSTEPPSTLGLSPFPTACVTVPCISACLPCQTVSFVYELFLPPRRHAVYQEFMGKPHIFLMKA